jgi:hypothetical protein
VRRRLFEPMTDPAQFRDRDVTAGAFADLYRTQQQEFPPECRNTDYEIRLKSAYPIHPEIFDRLYGDWSTLVKFQRTRGVLRLMAAVIHTLWEKGDRNPLILPANISIDDLCVQFELTRYLSENWVPVIDRDVDGPNSLPLKIDSEIQNLGKLAACRRVARTIYLGSAPMAAAAHRGIEDRRVKLGCVMPGEAPPVFGDALRRLTSGATYLYQDGPRYWYSTQPTVTKLAEDRAEQLRRDPDKVAQEIDKPCAPICATRASSAASTLCRNRARTCRTISMRGLSFSESITPTAVSPEARPRPPGRRSSKRAAAPRGSTATRSPFSPATGPGCRISTRRRGGFSPGNRSSTRRMS